MHMRAVVELQIIIMMMMMMMMMMVIIIIISSVFIAQHLVCRDNSASC